MVVLPCVCFGEDSVDIVAKCSGQATAELAEPPARTTFCEQTECGQLAASEVPASEVRADSDDELEQEATRNTRMLAWGSGVDRFAGMGERC